MSEQKISVVIVESGSYIRDTLESSTDNQFTLESCEREEDVQKKIGKPTNTSFVVLLDITDKSFSGLSTLGSLQARKRSDILVIVLSHSGEPVDIDQALRLGAEDYIIKEQFTREELVAKIKRAYTKLQSITQSPMETTPIHAGSIDVTNVHVLIIEDDQFLRDLSSRKLKQEGFQVDVAIDGNEGLKKIEDQKPDVVLLDIILPGIDGFDILQRVRSHKNETVRNSTVILLSNLGQEADVAKGQRLGADDYLIKANFTIDEIIEKIQVALSKKQSQKI